MKQLFLLCLTLGFMACSGLKTSGSHEKDAPAAPFLWENANVYFLLTDRFNNGSREFGMSEADKAATRAFYNLKNSEA